MGIRDIGRNAASSKAKESNDTVATSHNLSKYSRLCRKQPHTNLNKPPGTLGVSISGVTSAQLLHSSFWRGYNTSFGDTPSFNRPLQSPLVGVLAPRRHRRISRVVGVVERCVMVTCWKPVAADTKVVRRNG